MTRIPVLLGQAIQHHQAGRLAEAESAYQRILATQPKHPDALHLLGLIAYQSGRLDQALELMSRALRVNPAFPEALSNLGNTLRALGRLEEAAARFQKAITLRPTFADAHLNLGVVLADLGRLDEAATCYRRALSLSPGMAEAHGNLGNVLRGLRRPGEALSSYHDAIALRPDFADAHLNLGNALHDLGRLEEAARSFEAALAFNPGSGEALSNLGGTHLDLGRPQEAMRCLRQALAMLPNHAGAHFNLALALRSLGDIPGALAAARSSLEAAPHQVQGWILLAELLVQTPTFPDDEAFLDLLLTLLERPHIHPGSLSRPVYGVLKQQAAFTQVLEDPAVEAHPWQAAEDLSAIPLLLRIMALSPTIDLDVEALFTRLRRGLLRTGLPQGTSAGALPFCAALARQCHLNEYVFDESPEESKAVDERAKTLGERVSRGIAIPSLELVLLAAYRPLHGFAWADALLDREWPAEVNALLRQQLREPREEAALRAALPALTAVDDGVSRAVRDHYEENPYPRWVRAKFHERPRPLREVLRSLSPPMDPEGQDPERPEILIAGCGTGEQALGTASRFCHARILAVDLSRASLAYASRKAQEAGATTIDFAQADILALGGLGRSFDLIESAGVLHHMRAPMAGWQVLVDLLRPGGLMGIALYSEAARQPILRGRALIAERGFQPTPAGIRRCRQEILAGATETDRAWFATCRDFYSASECRDLLFHVQEHRFTLPQIETALQDLGLRFLGFEVPTDTWHRFQAFDPQAAPSSLAAWACFEGHDPDAFKGMYQFWCQKP